MLIIDNCSSKWRFLANMSIERSPWPPRLYKKSAPTSHHPHLESTMQSVQIGVNSGDMWNYSGDMWNSGEGGMCVWSNQIDHQVGSIMGAHFAHSLHRIIHTHTHTQRHVCRWMDRWKLTSMVSFSIYIHKGHYLHDNPNLKCLSLECQNAIWTPFV